MRAHWSLQSPYLFHTYPAHQSCQPNREGCDPHPHPILLRGET